MARLARAGKMDGQIPTDTDRYRQIPTNTDKYRKGREAILAALPVMFERGVA